MAEIQLRNITNFTNSDAYRKAIHELIPGGAHTYSKGDDQFPERSPAAFDHGKDGHLWDIDGNEFLDCSMGLTSVSVGHVYEPILDAVRKELERGVNFQRPSVLEKTMAETFLSLVPMHQMIKFAKNGSSVTTAAVKLARAKTGRTRVAFPGDHPFYSYDDWFIGSTPARKGVPQAFTDLSVQFRSCDIESLRALFEQYPGEIACVITEPEKSTCDESCRCGGKPGEFLRKAIDLAHGHGALFIIDEMITGFKTAFPGSITKYDLRPDMTTWGKGIANGFSFCALTGTREVMQLGGINRPGEEKVFLISTTHGGETHTMAAALATIEVFRENNVVGHQQQLGKMLAAGCAAVTDRLHLNAFIQVIQSPWMPTFVFRDASGEVSQGMRTLFMQEMIRYGVLFQGIFMPCFTHTTEDVAYFIAAFEAATDTYRKALDEGYEKYLTGEPAKPVFRKIL